MRYLTAAVLFILLGSVQADDFSDKFAKIRDGGDSVAIERFLKKAAVTEADNPNYYALAGNYWWQQASSVVLSRKPPEGADMSLTDPKTKKEIGSISNMGTVRPELRKKTIEVLSEGMKRFPLRADIALGLAYVEKEIGMKQECVKTLKALLAVAKKNSKDLKWMANGTLPKPAETFIPEAIQGYTTDLYQAGPESAPLCIELCTAVIDAFPGHPYAYNVLAGVKSGLGKDDEAIQLLQTANSKAPDDSLILLNLGDAFVRTHQKLKAIEAYKKVLALAGGPDSISQAKEALQSLENKPAAAPSASR